MKEYYEEAISISLKLSCEATSVSKLASACSKDCDYEKETETGIIVKNYFTLWKYNVHI